MELGLLTDSPPEPTGLEAFNATGNSLHPLRDGVGDRIVRSALRPAQEFGTGTVVLVSGLPAEYRASFLDAVRAAGHDGPVSIENEDYSLPQRESVAPAVRALRGASA